MVDSKENYKFYLGVRGLRGNSEGKLVQVKISYRDNNNF